MREGKQCEGSLRLYFPSLPNTQIYHDPCYGSLCSGEPHGDTVVCRFCKQPDLVTLFDERTKKRVHGANGSLHLDVVHALHHVKHECTSLSWESRAVLATAFQVTDGAWYDLSLKKRPRPQLQIPDHSVNPLLHGSASRGNSSSSSAPSLSRSTSSKTQIRAEESHRGHSSPPPPRNSPASDNGGERQMAGGIARPRSSSAAPPALSLSGTNVATSQASAKPIPSMYPPSPMSAVSPSGCSKGWGGGSPPQDTVQKRDSLSPELALSRTSAKRNISRPSIYRPRTQLRTEAKRSDRGRHLILGRKPAGCPRTMAVHPQNQRATFQSHLLQKTGACLRWSLSGC